MRILLATDSNKSNDYMSIQFVEEGVQPHKTTDKDEINAIIKKYECSALLIDIDSPNYQDLETIGAVREEFKDIAIIIMTSRSGVNFVKQVVELGTYGIISKMDDLEIQFGKIIHLLDTLHTRKEEKRKHIRVQPAAFQHNLFSLQIPGLDSEYQGQIKDISIGGVALTFSNPPSDSILFKGKEILLNIELGSMTLLTKGVVVLKGGMEAAILFRELSAGYKKRVSEYILSRLDSN